MSAPLLAVTTTRAVWILEPATGDAWEIESHRGAYYGVSSDGAHLYATARHPQAGTDPKAHRNLVLCFDAALDCVAVHHPPFPIRAAHQMVYSRGRLWIAATFDDCIISYHVADGTWDKWHPFGEPAAGQIDEHHINSVQFSGGEILLAGHKPHGWYARFDADQQPLDGGKQFLGNQTHNVWREGGDIWVCSTREGAMISSAGARKLVADGAWLRGVCRDGATTYVGVSQTLVTNRGASDSSVVALGADGRMRDCFTFHGFGMVHEIRALDRADVTHSGETFRVDLDAIRRTKRRYRPSRQLVALDQPEAAQALPTPA